MKGFNHWKNAFERFKIHTTSKSHIASDIQLQSARKVVVNVANQQVSSHSAEVKSNREHLAVIIDVIMFLSKQGLAFRGHREEFTDKNQGNFLEQLNFLGK